MSAQTFTGGTLTTTPKPGNVMATVVAAVTDTQAKVADVQFSIALLNGATQVAQYGPYPPDITRRPGWYEKDVVLHTLYTTRVDTTLYDETGAVLASTAESFGLRSADAGAAVQALTVRDADTDATATVLGFQGTVVSVSGGVATFDLDGRYALAGHTHSTYLPLAGGTLSGNLAVIKTGPRLWLGRDMAGAGGHDVVVEGTSTGQGGYLGFNLYLSGSGADPITGMLYSVDAGTASTGGGALRYDGNSKSFRFLTAPTSTGRGTAATLTERFRVQEGFVRVMNADFEVGGSVVITSARVLQNVTAGWGIITSGKPTTLAGYGITDAVTTAGGAIGSGALGFGSRLGQHLSLYGTSYGLGIQNSTLYLRTGGELAVYAGGTHNDALGSSGGGTELLRANGAGFTYMGTAVSLAGHTHSWAAITSGKPTTAAGYGITAIDAALLTSGTLPDARLGSRVALRDVNNAFTIAQYALPAPGTIAWGAMRSGDIALRWGVTGDGVHSFGTGTAAPDLNLYRSGAGILTTDGQFQASAGLYVGGSLVLTGARVLQNVTAYLSAAAGASVVLTKGGDVQRNFMRWNQGAAWWQAGFRNSPYAWVLEYQAIGGTPADDSGWTMALSAGTNGTVTVGGNLVVNGSSFGGTSSRMFLGSYAAFLMNGGGALPIATGGILVSSSYADTQYANALSFGAATRQMINLWLNTYGIGIQASTLYMRSESRFSWFAGGTHSDAQNDAGSGGSVLMSLTSGELTVTAAGINSAGYVKAAGLSWAWSGFYFSQNSCYLLPGGAADRIAFQSNSTTAAYLRWQTSTGAVIGFVGGSTTALELYQGTALAMQLGATQAIVEKPLFLRAPNAGTVRVAGVMWGSDVPTDTTAAPVGTLFAVVP